MTTDSARRPQAEDGEERARGSSHAPAARLRREGASSDRPGCKLNTSLRRRLISGHSSGLISLVLSATYDTLRWLSPSGISLLPWFQESEPSQLSHEGNTTHMDDQWSVPGQSLLCKLLEKILHPKTK
ncbi:PREDICTED: uncharacterized protein LOC105575166 isoform X4 [Cercocebus atys]|uniref:uncharacterized protein LOC105575166 isoform X4 n=1 Tax=Cercocebus atys TaxID=9531 RepID=UPI0005F3BDF5|nr:PREDICTED: uncharacterized protein LOC105575166 isoform X4 [Cercocebus atys]